MVQQTARARQGGSLISRLARDYAYVMPGFFLSLLAFVLLIPLFALALGTFVIWIGALLLPAVLRLATGFAELSRARLRHFGVEPMPVRYRPRSPGFAGWLRMLGDPRRWADLVFETLSASPPPTLTFPVAVTWTAAALGGITWVVWGLFLPRRDSLLTGMILEAVTEGAAPDAISRSYLLEAGSQFLLGCLFLVTLPLVMRGLARLDALITLGALGGGLRSMQDDPEPGPAPAASTAWPAGSGAGLGSGQALSVDAWTWIAAAFAAVAAVAIDWPLLAVLYGVPVVVAMCIAFAHGAALLLAVRWPGAGIALQTAATVGTVLAIAAAGTTEGQWPWPWPAMTLIVQAILILIVALRSGWTRAVVAWAAPQIAVVAAALLSGVSAGGWSSVIVSASVTGGALVIGIVLGQLDASRGALREERRTSADLSARRRELEERNRIAQELHDVVAHSMSVISVQATTAKYRLDGLSPEAEGEFHSIAESSRQALAEMRHLLALLRTPREGEAPALAPQPDVGDLPALVETTRQSGVRISLEVSTGTAGDGTAQAGPAAIPPVTGLAVYRIVQEALSNAVRHAPGSAIDVRVARDAERIVVSVENGPAAPAGSRAAAPGAGLGLIGVRERAVALGGSAEAGPTDQGGFRVRVELPV